MQAIHGCDAGSEVNTMVQSNSMLAETMGIKQKKSGTGIPRKDKVERVTTEIHLRMSNGPIKPEDERVSTLQTYGTNFMTEKASMGAPSRKIVQSKENIILSEISSMKNLE
uniref:Uncharacterized protein n=1 Tax=Favella ehrenbergii TaxID=182087 RepID=A0A7S3MLZ0_9SPIT|mmetsp:Transcript_26783/g.33370  ORF Transcript_26783/g.33370 Transcript_26783/m.33370 type:complete len:111 (+) Transcript_26783:1100-1432(+)